MAAQTTGSKSVVGDANSLMVLGACLRRLSLFHIDQTYKALRSPFFGLVQKDHICFGYLQHRSQCCNSSTGDNMPMSAADYAPSPVIPEHVVHREKRRFTVDQALSVALEQTRQVRGPLDVTDVVCLRLQSYMQVNDPILVRDDYAVTNRLNVVRRSLQTAQAARDCCRLQSLIQGKNTEVHGNLKAALGVIEAEAESVPQQQEHAVMNWCRDKGWLRPENRQWKLLAMIQRGLVVHDSVDCLTCLHHNKQLHGFDACVSHFTVVKNFHQNEAPSLDDQAE